MPNPSHLSAAPIVEGIVDIQVKNPAGLDINQFRSLPERFGFEGVGKTEDLHMMSVFVNQGPAAANPARFESGPIGVRWFSEDKHVIVQMRNNGFTFSRMTPYTSWDEIFPQITKLFKVYWSVAKPEEITRIAVRNINRLLFPIEVFRAAPEVFLTSRPGFPRDISSRPLNWMSRVQLRRDAEKIDAIITQVTEDNPIEGKQSVILDIDVFAFGPFPLDPDELLPRLHAMRQWKNDLFFGSLTDEAIRPLL